MSARVLVVDDEVRFRELYRQVLEQAGFLVHTAGSAEAALLAMRSDPPALVVSDVRMPGRDGLELLREARSLRVDLPLPVPAQAGTTLLEREIDYLREVLQRTGGNRTRAAEILGITRRGLIYKIKRYGL